MQKNVDVMMAYSSSDSHTDPKFQTITEKETMRIGLIINIDEANVGTSYRESAYVCMDVCMFYVRI